VLDALPPRGYRDLTFDQRYSRRAYQDSMCRDDPPGFRLLTDGGFRDEHW